MNTETKNILKISWLAIATSAKVLLTAMCSCACILYLCNYGIMDASAVMVYEWLLCIVILDQLLSTVSKVLRIKNEEE